jgi:hypothetical protein
VSGMVNIAEPLYSDSTFNAAGVVTFIALLLFDLIIQRNCHLRIVNYIRMRIIRKQKIKYFKIVTITRGWRNNRVILFSGTIEVDAKTFD